MEPAEALSVAVQVAVTLVGFTGLVAVFGASAIHQWKSLDRLRLTLLLTTSTAPLVLGLFALLLLTTGLPEDTVWRAASGIAALAIAGVGIVAQRSILRIPAPELSRSAGSRLVFYSTASVGLAIIVLLLANVIALATFWPLFASLITSMFAAIVQFVRLVLLRPGQLE